MYKNPEDQKRFEKEWRIENPFTVWNMTDWDMFFDTIITAIVEHGSMIIIGIFIGVIICCAY